MCTGLVEALFSFTCAFLVAIRELQTVHLFTILTSLRTLSKYIQLLFVFLFSGPLNLRVIIVPLLILFQLTIFKLVNGTVWCKFHQ